MVRVRQIKRYSVPGESSSHVLERGRQLHPLGRERVDDPAPSRARRARAHLLYLLGWRPMFWRTRRILFRTGHGHVARAVFVYPLLDPGCARGPVAHVNLSLVSANP